MLGPYIAGLLFGGVLLAMSVFAGGHDDADPGDADTEVDGDAHHDGDSHHHESGAHGGAIGGFLSTFASLRFWTFFFAFAGGAGSALTLLGLNDFVTAIAAAVMGASSGAFAVWTFRYLGRNEVNSSQNADEWVGRTARIMVPVAPKQPGKIRIELDGEVKDLIAHAAGTSESPMNVGDEVLIVEMTDGVAKVTLNGPDAHLRSKAVAAKT